MGTIKQDLVFDVQGSSLNEYEVSFFVDENGDIRAFCTCRAGQMGIYCKHRVALIVGDFTSVVGGAEKKDKLQELLKNSELKRIVEEVIQIEKEAKALNATLKKAKKKLQSLMEGD